MSAIQQMILATFAAAGLDTPNYISSGTFTSSSAGISVPAPDGYIDGDLLILAIHSANQTISTPSGWTEVTNSPQGTGTAGATGSTRLAVFYKFASGTQASVSITDTGAVNVGQMFAFRKVKSDTPFDATAGSVESTTVTTHTLPAITTTGQKVLVAHFSGLGLDADNSFIYNGAITNTNLANLTSQVGRTISNGAAAGGGLGLITGIKTDAGSTGTTSAAVASAMRGAFVTVGLSPTSNYSATDRVLGAFGEVSDYRGILVGGSSFASLTLNTDGTLTQVGNSEQLAEGWYSRQVTDIGASYYVRATAISGSGTGTTGSWLQLNSARTWSVGAAEGGDVQRWVLKLEFSTDSSGVTIVATTQLALTATTEGETVAL